MSAIDKKTGYLMLAILWLAYAYVTFAANWVAGSVLLCLKLDRRKFLFGKLLD